MKESNAMIRRAAIRSMWQIGAPAKTELGVALKSDTDVLVRRTALRALLELTPKTQAVDLLKLVLDDADDNMRVAAVEALVDLRAHSQEAIALLEDVRKDKSPNVSRIASQALWPFKKDGMTLREAPQYKDLQLSVAQTIPLPVEGWKFQVDVRQLGHRQKWFTTDFDDSAWRKISISRAWEEQIGQPYDGVGWYRHTFTLPEKPEQVGTDIVFEAVDESAWIWVNGEYVGQHDVGLAGWNQRFAMDVSDLLKWGQLNQITVRVLDRRQAGGIWKPVSLEVLKR